jgi:hypothetical protein
MVVRGGAARDADVIALSSMAGSHLPFCTRLKPLLEAAGLGERLWVIGGNIPAGDHDALRALGFKGVLPPARGSTRSATSSGRTCMMKTLPPGVRPVRNESGIEIQPLYTAEDVEASGGLAMLGRPGEYPFTRGIHPLMYRKQPFTMRQYTGFGNAADTNGRFKFLIANGQTGTERRVRPAHAVRLDSDDPMAEGEVGRVGMAVDTLRDFEIAFDGIDLDKITVSLTINGSGGDPDRDVPGDGREARLRPQDAARHGAERHPEGVRRPRHLDLSRSSPRYAWWATPSSTAPSMRPSTARCRCAATTSANRARRRRRRWPGASASRVPTPTR